MVTSHPPLRGSGDEEEEEGLGLIPAAGPESVKVNKSPDVTKDYKNPSSTIVSRRCLAYVVCGVVLVLVVLVAGVAVSTRTSLATFPNPPSSSTVNEDSFQPDEDQDAIEHIADEDENEVDYREDEADAKEQHNEDLEKGTDDLEQETMDDEESNDVNDEIEKTVNDPDGEIHEPYEPQNEAQGPQGTKEASTPQENTAQWTVTEGGDDIFDNPQASTEEDFGETYDGDDETEDEVEIDESADLPTPPKPSTTPGLDYFIEQCRANRAKNLVKGTPEYEVAAADCGWGYDFNNSAARETPWKVVLFGPTINHPAISDLMGNVGKCFLSPKCHIERIEKQPNPGALEDADVIVIFQSDAQAYIRKIPSSTKKKQFRVLYWREAQMASPDVQTQRQFDFEMGVHYYSGLLNPNFLRHPGQYLSGAVYPFPPFEFLPPRARAGKFALSIISHCHAGSLRDAYISRLQSFLGQDRIHSYGMCGGKKLPGDSINDASKLMSQYKFYLAFENTIEDGYVTEKLFSALNVPVLSVYYGALNVPNVTTTPSFIKVSDFKTPKELAAYMLYLDEHDDKYMEYHSWRKNPASFTKEFLETLQMKVAGPEELQQYQSRKIKRFPRTAQFCRLCDEKYVRYAAETTAMQANKGLVPHYMNSDEIRRQFLRG